MVVVTRNPGDEEAREWPEALLVLTVGAACLQIEEIYGCAHVQTTIAAPGARNAQFPMKWR